MGKVTDALGNGLARVTVSAGAGKSTITDGEGNYTLSELAAGTYTITPSKSGYIFSPASRQVTVPPDAMGVDFVGTAVGVWVEHIEVIQVTQDENNSVPLIAGKPTFVRVYLGCGPDGSLPANTTVQLRGYGPSGELPGSPLAPFSGYLSTACRESLRAQRGDLRKSLNFALPREWASGTVRLRPEVESAAWEEPFTFQESRPILVAVVPVDYQPPLSSWLCNTSGKPSNRIELAPAWAQRVLPTAHWRFERLPSLLFTEPLWGGLWCQSHNQDATNHLFNLLITWNRVWSQGADYVFGWLPNGPGRGLCRIRLADAQRGPSLGGQVAFGDDDPSEGPRIFAHEMGHLLRRPEIDQSCGVAYEGYRDWPYDPDRHIQEYGVDISGGSFTLKRPNDHYDYMTYCGSLGEGNVWTSPWTYSRIFSETLRVQVGAQAVSLVAEQPYFIASGLVYTDDTAVLDPIWVITTTTVSQNPPAGTQYCLEAQDASDTAQASHCFDLAFQDYETGEATNVDGFNVMLPYPSNVARVVLRKGSQVLAERLVSAHAPAVNVLSPNGGEAWAASGTYTITWTASDLDGDSLTYSILYSPDGSKWLPVGIGITQTQWVVNAAELAGGNNARVRVLASDGVNTSSDESDGPFSVGRKAPQAYILSPEEPITVTVGTPVWLQGYAYDLEDGALAHAALGWSSSQDGDLGTGSTVLASLSLGQHTVTFTATDSDGNPATATTQVLVTFPEDVVPDCRVDAADLQAMADHWRQAADPRFDLDGDGDVDVADVMRVTKMWGTSCP